MAKSYEHYSEWLYHAGKIIKLDGIAYKLKVSVYDAVYPIHERVISVYADPVNKHAKSYLKEKRFLGDDWSIDVLDSSIETYCEVLRQVEKQVNQQENLNFGR